MSAESARVQISSVISESIGSDLEILEDTAGLGVTPGWDSVLQVEIMAILEDELGTEITEESIRAFCTVGALKELLGNE